MDVINDISSIGDGYQQKDMVKFLLAAGANVNLQNKDGDTAFIRASKSKELMDEINDLIKSVKLFEMA